MSTIKRLTKSWYHDKQDLLNDIISKDQHVLDVGFWGQGIPADSPTWPHKTLSALAGSVDGLDMTFDDEKLKARNLDPNRYHKANAETFSLGKKYDVVFAGDLIEHLSNPGSFLDSARKHLAPGGFLIVTTPNAFNLFTMAGKLTRREPVVNSDHTCYFNEKTIRVLMQKNGWHVTEVSFLYSVGVEHEESWKKKILNGLYRILSWRTTKYFEDMVVIAEVNS